MRFFRLTAIATSLIGLATTPVALAIPTLQLDIGVGTYVGGTEESTVTDKDSFALYALLIPNSTSTTGENSIYRISAALVPKVDQVPSGKIDLGYYMLDEVRYDVTAGMVWGVPPSALLEAPVVGSTLPTHSIFPTYYQEYDIVNTEWTPAGKYNVADVSGIHNGPTSGSGLYYVGIDVDISHLAEGFGLHFDLYQVAAVEHYKTTTVTTGTGKKKKVTKVEVLTSVSTDIVQFAPFSHDAETGTHRVPDGGATLALLGLGLAGLGFVRRRVS